MVKRAAPTDRSLVLRRCAIYTRKSTTHGLEQDFNSLDAQYESCEAYIRAHGSEGWRVMTERYDDGGYTGANVERPAFQRLLADLSAGKVDVVVVYKADRLSRSLLDFAQIMDQFARADVAFVSVTQNFSTADAIGRLTLNMLMSFAEFEREMIAERTRDKIRAARRRGKWTGGVVPLGYRVEHKQLFVDEATAPLAREVFALYRELESAVAVAERLSQIAHRACASWSAAVVRTRPWTKNDVLRLLRNPVYGGCLMCGDELRDGEHQELIPLAQWKQVQATIERNRTNGLRRARNPRYLLRGILRCAACGAAMTPAPSRHGDRVYRYYRCATRDRAGKTACAAPSVAADRIEHAVELELRRLAIDPATQQAAFEAAGERLGEQQARLVAQRAVESAQARAAGDEAKALVARLAVCDPGAERAIGRRVSELDARQRVAEQRQGDLDQRIAEAAAAAGRLTDARAMLATLDDVWPRLTFENRGRLIRTLISRVELAADGVVRIELVDGRGGDATGVAEDSDAAA